MSEMGLRPERGHVKSSRVVGEVMGKYHPHGDAAIYDALVRMAQPFTHAPAARRRARQLRLARRRAGRVALHRGAAGAGGAADDRPGSTRRPSTSSRTTTTSCCSPACCRPPSPTCWSTARSGIAVGMATNMAPHNLVEVIGAARHLIAHPDALARRPDAVRARARPAHRRPDRRARGHPRGLRDRPRLVPHPRDHPDRDRHRARKGIVVTELPYTVGPEKVIEKIKDLVQAKKLQGIADVKDLTDRTHGLRLVIEVKNGFNPEAVLEQLYRLTPMEDSFGINNVALVDGQPRTLGLKDLLRVYVDFRIDVVRRRTAYRLRQARGAAAPGRGPAHRDRRHRRGHPADPHLRRRRRRQGPADGGLRPVRPAGDLHPRPAAAPADQVLPDRARGRAGRAAAPRSRSCGRSSATRRCCCKTRLHRAGRGRQGARHAAAHRAAGVGRCAAHRRHAAGGRRRPVLGAAVLDRPAGPHHAPTTRCRPRAAGTSTTPSSPRSGRPRAATSGWSPHAAG